MGTTALPLTLAVLALPSAAQITTRISVAPNGAQADSCSFLSAISVDGRYIAFQSYASNLVPGETNGQIQDVFVRDRQSGTTERASVASGGAQGDDASTYPSISADGRYVAFESEATNLVGGDTNARSDVFVHDRQNGTTDCVSVDSNGIPGDGISLGSWISADGRFVAFTSTATNLVPGDTNGTSDVFVRDRQAGTTGRVSVDSNGVEGNGFSGDYYHRLSISADGRFVSFSSSASNLVIGDTNGRDDVFVRDRLLATTERVSVSSTGVEGDYSSRGSSISMDGRFVAFCSEASTLVGGDVGQNYDVFVRDRQLGTTERVSIDSNGVPSNDQSGMFGLEISSDGRYVVFESAASNLVPGDTNSASDIFIRDREGNTTQRVSVSTGGTQGVDYSYRPSISPDGRFVAFSSNASNLVVGDTNGCEDLFLRDRHATGFTSLCDPGVTSVQACPCSNPPSSAGRGCDNSAVTGGAVLAASGIAYLSMDSLVFTTSGERPTATSILLQGTVLAPNGILYGQGLRCVAGSLKRLFTKSASGGSITAPNFGGGDPTVSARSAAKGDVIQAGQSRWYLVFYRDPTVLGGCPATSTFNATQSGRVDWSL